jgi:molecular chaperone GrpE
MEELKKGRYRHYKGGEYRLLTTAKNSETQEDQVVYESLKDERVWVRPKKMFFEEVEVDGAKKPRFEFLGEDEDEPYEQKYLRALADYQNLQKQQAKERQEFVKFAIEDFLNDIIPVYDHLKLSLKGLSEEERANPWAQGVALVLKQFKEVLATNGVEEIATVGQPFDYESMEALSGQGETVKQEVSPGYRLNGKVVRPAKVIV